MWVEGVQGDVVDWRHGVGDSGSIERRTEDDSDDDEGGVVSS